MCVRKQEIWRLIDYHEGGLSSFGINLCCGEMKGSMIGRGRNRPMDGDPTLMGIA
jgi:hypothetical protein